jgi:hypothetical protein
LALALGKTVAELLDDLGDGELEFWYAYNRYVEPIPNPWVQTAVLGRTFANSNPWDSRNHRLDQFMPRIEKQKQVIDPTKLHRQFLAAMTFLGKKIAPEKESGMSSS